VFASFHAFVVNSMLTNVDFGVSQVFLNDPYFSNLVISIDTVFVPLFRYPANSAGVALCLKI